MFRVVTRFWRIFRTGIAFALFGVGALFLTLFIFPPIIYFVRDFEKRKLIIRGIISNLFKSFLYFMHFTALIKFRSKRIELLKRDSSCILISNHPTLIDVVSIVAFLPNACCIVKKKLWGSLFLGGVVKAAGYIPNNNNHDFMSRCKHAIENGDVLVIFPEGTRTKPGKSIVFQRGAAHIALMLGCPVRCVEIQCDPITLSKGQPWYQAASKRVAFSLFINKKLSIKDFIKEDLPRPKAARALTRFFMEHY